jgi:hypothetical protein
MNNGHARKVEIVATGKMDAAALSDFQVTVRAELADLAGVDAVYLGHVDEGRAIVYVIATEHGIVDRDALFHFEDVASSLLHRPVDARVRAHQGRGAEEVSEGQRLL